MRRQLRHPMVWLAEHVNVVLIFVLLIAGGTWGFIKLADEVVAGQTQRFDTWVLRELRHQEDPSIPIGPWWLPEVARDVTALGSAVVLLLATATVAGFLFIIRKHHAMWLVLAAALGGLILSHFLKLLVHRARPELVPHLMHASSLSFPSGHSMGASAVYLTLAALLAQLFQGPGLKIYMLGAALVLTFLVGLTRIYLGVHYPTDVLAGWVGGSVWALLCWLVVRYLQRRGAVEKASKA